MNLEISITFTCSLGYALKPSEESARRHSSDMEMDDGEDDLDNYKGASSQGSLSLHIFLKFSKTEVSCYTYIYKFSESKLVDNATDYRQNYLHKTVNFSKNKDTDELSKKRMSDSYYMHSTQSKTHSGKNTPNSRDLDGETNSSSDENQKSKEERVRLREKEKNSDERKREEYRRKDERDCRRKDEDKWRDSERDRRRESEKYRDDKERDRKRSPDR